MGWPQKRVAWISPDDYLAMEVRAETKHEYLDGVVYDWQGTQAMAGGSKAHNRVSGNVYASLREQLRGGPCAVFMADVRLHRADRQAYFYPDVAVTCSAADRAEGDHIAEPAIVVEVLSPTTADFDRGDKFAAYRAIPSLQAYVLVSPEGRSVEVFARDADWRSAGEVRRSGCVELGAHGLRLELAEVFEGL